MEMKIKEIHCVVFSMTVLVPSTAFAYLEPGTGSMIVQLLLGGLAGLVVVLKMYWERLRALFGVRRSNKPTETKDSPNM